MKSKIAVVTGANRGIGFEIAKQLGKQGLTVILTSRNEEKGLKACHLLKQEGLDVHFHTLDVTDELSIQELAHDLKDQFGKIDILINNAGVYIDGNKTILTIDLETIRKTFETNVYGPLRLAQEFVPLLQNSIDGRIINISSGMGALEDLSGGYPSYSLSKTSLNGITIQLAEELREKGISVNSMCPGWVQTDMGGQNAPRTVEKGADTAVWLASTEIRTTGKFFRDRKEIAW